MRDQIIQRQMPVEELTITRKIGSAEKRLLRLGQPGEVVSYYYVEQKCIHSRRVSSQALESTEGEYWVEWYLEKLDQQLEQITGATTGSKAQLALDVGGDCKG